MPVKLTMGRLQGRVWRLGASLRNELPTRRPSRGESGVWIGGIPTRRQWRRLKAEGVRTVIALTDEVEPPEWIESGPNLHWLPLRDKSGPGSELLSEACGWLDAAVAARHGSLVYCGAGKGRAPTVYAAWLIWRGADVADALARMSRARPVAKPTEDQLQALGAWSRVCRRKS